MRQSLYYKEMEELPIASACLGSILVNNKFRGSAFVAHRDNLIITSAHNLVPIDGPITYHTAFDKEGQIKQVFTITEHKIIKEYDLAILKSNKAICQDHLQIAKESKVGVFDIVYYFGFDQGNVNDQKANRSKDGSIQLNPEGRYIYQAPVISVSKTKIEPKGNLIDYIEYKNYCVPGFSGGATFNKNNEVIAVNSRAWLMKAINKEETFVMNQAFLIYPILELINAF